MTIFLVFSTKRCIFAALNRHIIPPTHNIVMPDHFHGVLFVEERMDISVGRIIRGFKVACTQRWRLLTGQPSPLQGQPSLVDTPTKGSNGAQNEGPAWIDYGRTSLNDQNNLLIYKAFPKSRNASPILASPSKDLLIFFNFLIFNF